MLTWRAQGFSFHRIAAELNRLGVKTKNAGQRICLRTNRRIPGGQPEYGIASGRWQAGNVAGVLESRYTRERYGPGEERAAA